MAAPILCCDSSTPCTSNCDNKASYLEVYFSGLVHTKVCIHRLPLAISLAMPTAFISVCSACRIMFVAKDSDVVECGHEHALLSFLYSFRSLPITNVVDRNYLHRN